MFIDASGRIDHDASWFSFSVMVRGNSPPLVPSKRSEFIPGKRQGAP